MESRPEAVRLPSECWGSRGGPDMTRIQLSETIGGPVEEVFARLTDFEGAPRTISQIQAIEMLTAGPVGVGTRFRETRKLHGHTATEVMEVAEFEPNRRYVLVCKNYGAEYRTEFRFTPEGTAATRVEVEFGVKAVSVMAKLMKPLSRMMMGMIEKCIARDLADLKGAIERGEGESAVAE